MKQLNVNGSEICSYKLEVVSRNQNDFVYEDLYVEIITSQQDRENSYRYTMHSDEIVPTVDWLKQALKERLDAAKKDYLSFKISEDNDRRDFLIQVGGNRFEILQVQGEIFR